MFLPAPRPAPPACRQETTEAGAGWNFRHQRSGSLLYVSQQVFAIRGARTYRKPPLTAALTGREECCSAAGVVCGCHALSGGSDTLADRVARLAFS
jgi:hypothetical protein